MRVLIVDDDASVRGLIRAMLEQCEFEVAEAADGEEGAESFRRWSPDVILCDLFMPGRDGLEMIRELSRDFPDVKVIAMSGGGFGGVMDMLSAARLLGAVGVLAKPFSQKAARAAIERALGLADVSQS